MRPSVVNGCGEPNGIQGLPVQLTGTDFLRPICRVHQHGGKIPADRVDLLADTVTHDVHTGHVQYFPKKERKEKKTLSEKVVFFLLSLGSEP